MGDASDRQKAAAQKKQAARYAEKYKNSAKGKREAAEKAKADATSAALFTDKSGKFSKYGTGASWMEGGSYRTKEQLRKDKARAGPNARGEVHKQRTDFHKYWTPQDVRSLLTSRASGLGGSQFTKDGQRKKSYKGPSDDQVMKTWKAKNTHADRYRYDPAYKAKWDAGRGGKFLGSKTAKAVGLTAAKAAIGGKVLGAFKGADWGFGGTTAASGGAAASGATAATGAGGMGLDSIFSGSNIVDMGLGILNYTQSQNAIDDQRSDIQAGFNQQNPWASQQKKYGQKLDSLLSDPSSIRDTPGYQFQLDQGTAALEARQAQSGNRFSGRALTEATTFGQGLASQMYNQEINRYMELAGVGPNQGGTGASMSALTDQENFNQGYFWNNLFDNMGSNNATSVTDQGGWQDPYNEDAVN